MTTHIFSLNSPWYELVNEGKKVYEGRRNSDKIRQISVNDIIMFYHHTDKTMAPIITKVQEVIYYPTFRDALCSLPLQQVLPLPDMTVDKGVEIYKRFVSEGTQERDGVAMIRLKLLRLNPTQTKHTCDNIIKRYEWDCEGAHQEEDELIFHTLKDLVECMETTNDMETLKNHARECMDHM